MNKLKRMWEDHLEILAMSFPSLHYLRQDDEASLELLDFYMVDSLETFIAHRGVLNPRDIVLLYNNKRSLAGIFKRLDGVVDSNGYFEQLLMMSKEVLRRVNVKEAHLIVTHIAEHE